MKKLFLFCFSLLFIAASSGASLNIHYCWGKVSAVSLSLLPAPSCACGKKASKKACCKNETKLVKMQDDARQPSVNPENNLLPVVALPQQTFVVAEAIVTTHLSGLSSATDPPDDAQVPLYIRHRVFRL